ncbi:MAG: hypothetical protein P4L53_17810 [Candidatus Obscuribacterales bacterium]|nr:hypothetical protein [Candidatus Obscuribacterales bacterium]
MVNSKNEIFESNALKADREVSKNDTQSNHLNLLELTRYFGKGAVEGAARPIEGLAQIVTGKKMGATEETQKVAGVDGTAEHLGQYAGEAFDYLVAMRLGKGALNQAENRYGFNMAKTLGTTGASLSEKAVSISAGGLTGFLEPTRNGGLDLSQRSKNAFLGASSTGLFEGSSHLLSSSGLAGSVFKDGAKVFASSFVAGGATAELQSRVNFKEDASLKDILGAGAMWGITGSALHFSGKAFSRHQAKIEEPVTEEPLKASKPTDSAVKIGNGELSELASIPAVAERQNILAEVPSEMAKSLAEAAAMKKRDEASIKPVHRTG